MWNQGGWPGYGQMGYGGHMGFGDGGYWMMGFGGILWLIFLVLLIVGAVALIRYLWHGTQFQPPAQQQQQRPGSALSILEARYARGEIDRNEFLEKKQDLAGGG